METQPQLITFAFRDTYERIKATYPHRAHLEVSRREHSLYGVYGRNPTDEREFAPLPADVIPPTLQTILETAETKKESSESWLVPSRSRYAWKGVEALEWENFTLKVAPHRISTPKFIEQVATYIDRQRNNAVYIRDNLVLPTFSTKTLDLMVIALMGSQVYHQEPLFEHTFGGHWRASKFRGSCF